jgi:hypothetical protein
VIRGWTSQAIRQQVGVRAAVLTQMLGMIPPQKLDLCPVGEL